MSARFITIKIQQSPVSELGSIQVYEINDILIFVDMDYGRVIGMSSDPAELRPKLLALHTKKINQLILRALGREMNTT